MKIFLVGTSFEPSYGGPAVSVTGLARALARAGGRVGLWSPDRSALTSPLIDDISCLFRFGGRLSEALAGFGHPDVIHDNGIWLSHNHRVATVAAALRVPRVVSTRGMLEPWAMQHKKWKKLIAWHSYQSRDLRAAGCLHATAAAEASHLEQLHLGVPIRTIPNGADLPQSASSDIRSEECERRQIALFIGRIYPVKGLLALVEAWNRVRPRGWVLQIAGPDEAGHRAEIERAIASASLSMEVSLVGALDEAHKEIAFSGADIFILPSYSESFGMVVAEALAHGVPVLTTTGVPWPLLEARGCGWRVEPTVEALAEGLRIATTTAPTVLSTMGNRGREWMAAEFGWPRIANDFLATYRDTIAHFGSATA